jgi:hypothetical protein
MLIGLVAMVCALATLAIAGATGATAGRKSPPEMSLTFPTGEAHPSGSRASAWATCRAPEALVCNGTLTTSGSKHRVPFTVIAGTNQSLDLPLAAGSKADRVLVIVRTAQASGALVRTRTVLHLR